MWRWILTAIVVVVALVFWYITLTEPMISATAPAVIAIFFSTLGYFTWPNHSRLFE